MDRYSVVSYYKLLPFNQYLKSVIKIGFNNKYKGPSFVWYRLSSRNINSKNIKKRLRFKTDGRVPELFRATNRDYKYSGYNRGHLASDASFDYNDKVLKDVYVYSNAVPQKQYLNAYVWGGIERYSRYVALKLKYVYVVNLVIYGDDKIGDGVGVPEVMYKVIINKKHKFLRIFRVTQDDREKGLKPYLISYEEMVDSVR